jgi:thiol-disulfide isomerase/thioredoxin
MKQQIILWAMLLIPALISAQEEPKGTGISFFQGSFEDAKELAKAEGKLIFVDAFAVWCGPCKRMANTVFTQEEVGKVYNTYFVNLKIDMEKPMGQAFGKKYPVSAYPTLFYLDADGNIMEKVVGGRSVEDFITLGQKFSEKASLGGVNYAKLYEEGQRSAEVVYHYVAQLNKSGKNSLPVVNEYIKGKAAFSGEWELRLLYEGTKEADSKVFDLFAQHQKELKAFYSEEEVTERALNACRTTVIKAAEFSYPALKDQAKEKVKSQFPKSAKAFALEAELIYAAENINEKEYVKLLADVEKVMGDKPQLLYQMAALGEKHFPANEQVRAKSIQWLEKIKTKELDSKICFLLAQLQFKNGDKDKAKENAEKALELADPKKDNTYPIRNFLIRFNG